MFFCFFVGFLDKGREKGSEMEGWKIFVPKFRHELDG